ncbi:MAG: ATP synthase F1 subunit epsilon [Micavibrio sp.]|nr:MAG: ATP synthase F1 subunit epsilon [Micavibrio sp.]
MANTETAGLFHFSLVSPEAVLLSENIRMVTVPGAAGDFGILADHAPLLSSLRDGVAVIDREDGSSIRVFVSGGFADVNGNVCTLLAEDAAMVDELDRAELTHERDRLDERMKMLEEDGNLDEAKKQRMMRRLERLEAKIALAA